MNYHVYLLIPHNHQLQQTDELQNQNEKQNLVNISMQRALISEDLLDENEHTISHKDETRPEHIPSTDLNTNKLQHSSNGAPTF